MHPSRPLAAYPAAILLAATMPQLAQARELVGFSDAYSSGTVLPGSPAEFGKLIADDTEKWGKVVKLSGAKPE